jgi:hypothetical protein
MHLRARACSVVRSVRGWWGEAVGFVRVIAAPHRDALETDWGKIVGNFSEAYAKARTTIQTGKFATDWQKFIDTEAKIKSALGVDCPEVAHGDAFDKLRLKLDGQAKKGFMTFFTGNGLDEVILAAAKENSTDTKIGQKAACIKMLKHLYLVRKVGNQDIWIYAPPKAYSKWIFEEIKGDDTASKSKLTKETEVYSAKDRGVMCDALQEAAAWCQKVQVEIAKPAGEAIVKSWFMDSAATPQNLTQAIDTLKEGFKKIDNACRGGQLIFSDEPGDRNNGGWKDWAFVYTQEAMKVVYLQGAFLKAGNSGNKTMCALTIIHELTHKLLKTKDHRYDYDGLKPTATFPFAKAIDNADSWGYFAADICGMLSASDKKRVLA